MKKLFSILISAVMVFCFLSCEENAEITASASKDISNKSKLATFIKGDGSILYFDTYQDLIDSLKLNDSQTTTSSTEPATKAAWDASVNVTFYKDTKYRDTKRAFTFNFPSQVTGTGIADLSSIGMLNMISSLKIVLSEYIKGNSTFVTFWDQKNFKGYSVTWLAKTGSNDTNVPDLTKLLRGGRPPLAPVGTWNDAAQSARFGFQTSKH